MVRAAAPNFWVGRKVLVTGASGFVGAWLTRRLLGQGAAVVGMRKVEAVGFRALPRGNRHGMTERSGFSERVWD